MSNQSYEERAAELQSPPMTWRQWEKIRKEDEAFYNSPPARSVRELHQQRMGMLFHG